MIIEDLHAHPELIPGIARAPFDQWGLLTGAQSLDEHIRKLEKAGSGVPSALVGELLRQAYKYG